MPNAPNARLSRRLPPVSQAAPAASPHAAGVRRSGCRSGCSLTTYRTSSGCDVRSSHFHSATHLARSERLLRHRRRCPLPPLPASGFSTRVHAHLSRQDSRTGCYCTAGSAFTGVRKPTCPQVTTPPHLPHLLTAGTHRWAPLTPHASGGRPGTAGLSGTSRTAYISAGWAGRPPRSSTLHVHRLTCSPHALPAFGKPGALRCPPGAARQVGTPAACRARNHTHRAVWDAGPGPGRLLLACCGRC